MNENPEIASLWKGRILFGIEHEDVENPKYEVQPVHDIKLLEQAQQFYKTENFYVLFEADSVIMTPEQSQGYSLRLKIGEHSWETSVLKKNTKKGVLGVNYNRWGERSELLNWQLPYKSIKDMGQVFIYLMHNDHAISYARFDATQFTSTEPKLTWT